jgi:hydroxymethylpyrimidine pyrophosphatase-like HAD family hydrolase/GTPase SAR1 family protein
MIVHVLACDYDGTLADGGRVSPETRAALARVRASGRKLMLVTGRVLPDLRHVCPEADVMFDAIVAENGGVLYFPAEREVKVIGSAPEPSLVEALRKRRVSFDLGSSIVATLAQFAEPSVAAIREAGVERSLVFNKGSLMLLPGGVTKATGLNAALQVLGLSAHNTVGVGDAENDHAFLSECEVAVAVADAVPALRERADVVTREPGPRGVVEFIERYLLDDLADLASRIDRHRLVLGERPDGTRVRLPAHGIRLLVVGPSASGKSTITGVIVERLVETGRSFCLFDPEGDYQALTELEGVVVLGGKSERALPDRDALTQLVRRPRGRFVLNLSALDRREKVAYATKALAAVAAARSECGMPHWLIVDEADHVFPADGAPTSELLDRRVAPAVFVTLGIERLSRALLELPNTLVSTDLDEYQRTLGAILAARGGPASVAGAGDPPLERGEAAIAWLNGALPRAERFRVARRRLEHRRHVRKYAEGELPPDRSFYFRGVDGALNLRASNLVRFCELAEGVDGTTWNHHLRRGDYSSWIRTAIKDPELADEVHAVESSAELAPSDTLRRVLEAVRRRYTV